MAKTKQAKTDDTMAKLAAALGQDKGAIVSSKLDLTPTKKEAKTATFTGTLTAFGLMTIPVKTYKSTDADSVSFNQVHTCKDGTIAQLKQGKMTCSCCGEAVEGDKIQKGFKVADKFITVTKEEIEAQKSASDKEMTLTEWVDAADIDPIFYESTEFIAADKGGEKPLALLLAGMQRTGKVAKGRRVKGGREQVFVLRPFGSNKLAVSYLFADYEVRSFDKPVNLALVSSEEVELAATLIERYEEKFTPATEDPFLANVRRMLEAKAEGQTVVVPVQAAPKAVTVDLMAALKASLAAAPAKKSAKAGK